MGAVQARASHFNVHGAHFSRYPSELTVIFKLPDLWLNMVSRLLNEKKTVKESFSHLQKVATSEPDGKIISGLN